MPSNAKDGPRCWGCEKVLGPEEKSFECAEGAGVLCYDCAACSLLGQECSFCGAKFSPGEEIFSSSKGDKLACTRCVQSTAAKGGRPPHCSGCAAEFGPEDPVFASSSEPDAYLCQRCKDARAAEEPAACGACGAEFGDGESAYRAKEGDGGFLCKACAEKAMPACAACGKPALGKVAQLGDKTYHTECLVCTMCTRPISGQCQETSKGLICKPCASDVAKKAQKVQELMAAGDIAGAAKLLEELNSGGRKLPVVEEPQPDLKREESKGRIVTIFRAWDKSGDGFITQAELERALVAMGMPAEGAAEMMAAADVNKDGKVDYEEFLAWVFQPESKQVLQNMAAALAEAPRAAPAKSSNLNAPLEALSSFWKAYKAEDPREADSEEEGGQVESNEQAPEESNAVAEGDADAKDDGAAPDAAQYRAFKGKEELLEALTDPAVSHVDLSECENVNDALLKEFALKATHVRFICLDGCSAVTNDGLEALAGRCPELLGVSLGQCTKVTDAGVAALAAKCPALQRVNLTFMRVSGNCLKALAQHCPGLRSLEMAVCNRVTDEHVQQLAQRCRRLRAVDFTRCPRLTDASLVALAQNCGQLRMVSVSCAAKVTDAGVKTLAAQLNGLRELDVTGCHLITNEGLASLAKNSPQLQTLSLGGLREVTDAGVASLADCGELRSVVLRGCIITDACVPHLLACKSLKHVELLTGILSGGGLQQLRGHGLEVELR